MQLSLHLRGQSSWCSYPAARGLSLTVGVRPGGGILCCFPSHLKRCQLPVFYHEFALYIRRRIIDVPFGIHCFLRRLLLRGLRIWLRVRSFRCITLWTVDNWVYFTEEATVARRYSITPIHPYLVLSITTCLHKSPSFCPSTRVVTILIRLWQRRPQLSVFSASICIVVLTANSTRPLLWG